MDFLTIILEKAGRRKCVFVNFAGDSAKFAWTACLRKMIGPAPAGAGPIVQWFRIVKASGGMDSERAIRAWLNPPP